jgi:hypothetical protein
MIKLGGLIDLKPLQEEKALLLQVKKLVMFLYLKQKQLEMLQSKQVLTKKEKPIKIPQLMFLVGKINQK